MLQSRAVRVAVARLPAGYRFERAVGGAHQLLCLVVAALCRQRRAQKGLRFRDTPVARRVHPLSHLQCAARHHLHTGRLATSNPHAGKINRHRRDA